jgi:hypothetical protein
MNEFYYYNIALIFVAVFDVFFLIRLHLTMQSLQIKLKKIQKEINDSKGKQVTNCTGFDWSDDLNKRLERFQSMRFSPNGNRNNKKF